MERNDEVNKRLKMYIEQNDKKVSAIADKAGISRDIFSRIVNSKRCIFANEIPAIAAASGMTIAELLNVKE